MPRAGRRRDHVVIHDGGEELRAEILLARIRVGGLGDRCLPSSRRERACRQREQREQRVTTCHVDVAFFELQSEISLHFQNDLVTLL